MRTRNNPGFVFCNPERRIGAPIFCRQARHSPRECRHSNTLWFLLAALLFFLIPARGRCGDPAWRVLIEPEFMKHEVAFPIPESKRAEMAPALLKEGNPVCMTRREFDALKTDWKTFLQTARENASEELKKLTPEFTRDKKQVIEFATLTSSSPLTAGVVLAPDFLKMFGDSLGPKVIVAIPNRYTVYVFPALASHYREYASMIFEAYRATPYSVSTEAFELSADGLKAVGVYQEP